MGIKIGVNSWKSNLTISKKIKYVPTHEPISSNAEILDIVGKVHKTNLSDTIGNNLTCINEELVKYIYTSIKWDSM